MMANETIKKGSERQPAVPVQVKCGDFRCLAFKDKNGVWRDYFRGTPLPESVIVMETFDSDKIQA